MAKLGAVQSPGYPFHPANPAENDLPPRRKLILDTIREADAPLQPREIANELHLHLNTIRDHLAALVEAGLLIRKTVPHAGRSRLGLRRGLAQFHQHPDAGQLPTGTGGENPL